MSITYTVTDVEKELETPKHRYTALSTGDLESAKTTFEHMRIVLERSYFGLNPNEPADWGVSNKINEFDAQLAMRYRAVIKLLSKRYDDAKKEALTAGRTTLSEIYDTKLQLLPIGQEQYMLERDYRIRLRTKDHDPEKVRRAAIVGEASLKLEQRLLELEKQLEAESPKPEEATRTVPEGDLVSRV